MHDDPELVAAVRDAHVRGLGHEDVFELPGGRGPGDVADQSTRQRNQMPFGAWR